MSGNEMSYNVGYYYGVITPCGHFLAYMHA